MTTVVGLVADPGLPTRVAEDLAGDLPGVLARLVDHKVTWQVQVVTRALPLDESGNVEMWRRSDSVMEEHGWDMMVCLTELTRRLGDRFVVSDLNAGRGVGLISLPALGPVRLRRRVREAFARTVMALVSEDPDVVEREAARDQRAHASAHLGGHIEHEVADLEEGTNSYLSVRGRAATARLVAGMVRINEPWRLVPALDRAIAAAAATSAFGVFYSSIWTMADALSPLRLSLISLAAMVAMVAWLIFHNGLWDRGPHTWSPDQPLVYNLATLITVGIGVVCLYVLLMLLVLLGVLTVIPTDYLSRTLGHAAGFADYVTLAWYVSSLGTFAGALGSSFETEDAIQRATYSRREHERHVVRQREQT